MFSKFSVDWFELVKVYITLIYDDIINYLNR